MIVLCVQINHKQICNKLTIITETMKLNYYIDYDSKLA